MELILQLLMGLLAIGAVYWLAFSAAREVGAMVAWLREWLTGR